MKAGSFIRPRLFHSALFRSHFIRRDRDAPGWKRSTASKSRSKLERLGVMWPGYLDQLAAHTKSDYPMCGVERLPTHSAFATRSAACGGRGALAAGLIHVVARGWIPHDEGMIGQSAGSRPQGPADVDYEAASPEDDLPLHAALVPARRRRSGSSLRWLALRRGCQRDVADLPR